MSRKHFATRPSVLHWRPRGRVFQLVLAAVLVMALAPLFPLVSFGANPAAKQIYFVPLPDDVLFGTFDVLDTDGGTWDAWPPVRTIVSISIGSTGTLVYYDQWEDGGYDADIANPANLYSAGNLDGTQIWGDGNCANGFAPSIKNVAQTCNPLDPNRDQLQAGDVITLDNDVAVEGAPDPPYSRDPNKIFFDGRDKIGATFPVAVSRAAWPTGEPPGTPIATESVLAGAAEVFATSQWGTSYQAPVGTGTPDANTSAFEYAALYIMAGPGGATIDVDANADGDVTDGGDLDDEALTQGENVLVTGILEGATVTASAGAVQVHLLTGDVGDTFELRWYALVPRPEWYTNYYAPVGTDPESGTNRGCTEIWAYNPATIQVSGNVRDEFSTQSYSNNDGSDDWKAAWDEGGTGADDDPAAGEIQVAGNRLRFAGRSGDDPYVQRAVDLTGQGAAILSFDLDTSGNLTDSDEFAVFIDQDGAGTFTELDNWTNDVTGPFEYDISAYIGANTTVRFGVQSGATTTGQYFYVDNVDIRYGPDATITVNYDFPGGASPDGSFNIPAMSSGQSPIIPYNQGIHLWTPGGEPFLPIAVIDCTRDTSTTDGRLFDWGYPVIPADRLTGEVLVGWAPGCSGENPTLCVDPDNPNEGSRSVVWVTPVANTTIYVDFDGDGITCPGGADADQTIVANALVSYRINDDPVSEGGPANGEGDYDMTGARIRTCDGVDIAVAYGQNPALSASNDEEALDLGTVVLPFGADITIEKSGDKTEVARGGEVLYTYVVRSTGEPLVDVSVTDDTCSPALPTLKAPPNETRNVGDDNNDGFLDPDEDWEFTCATNIYYDTTNVAFASGSPDGGTTFIDSSPDQWTVLVQQPAAIGDYVWFDEDGDGDQDAGEAGIPNVQVTLTGNDEDGNPLSLTTYTDANGGYIFKGLPPSDGNGYTITVVNPPASLSITYDEDDGTLSPDGQTVVVLPEGVEHMTADFGYNWAPPADTNDPQPGVLGAIGDRVWIDANGNGVQDPGEAGLGNVTLRLYTDPDGDGVYDNEIGSTQTDAAGFYIFDDLPPDAYVVAVDSATVPTWYNQTGDPDDTLDNQTTTPVVLAPGDVFLNADFGYQPDPADENRESNTIGDTVFLDANGDGNEDSGEPGIPNVTVALIQDDGDGVYEPGVDPIIATNITDENGQYLFEGLPDGDYIVWVNDTDNVLGELSPTGDGDDPAPPPATPNRSAVSVASNETNLEQDFGYAPPGHDEGEGLIGDTIFLDRNNSGTPDPGEGLEGVVVELYDETGTALLFATTTDENGNYYFGGLDASTEYRVVVDTTTLPNSAVLTNSVDPEGNSDSQSNRDLALTGPVDLDADFGYVVDTNIEEAGNIVGTIWEDTNADGALDGDEPDRFAGVTVVLLDPDGNIVATTTTDGTGGYSFNNLPPGNYVVDVTDDDNVLDGYWHSIGTPNTPGQSQTDPKPVTVNPGQTVVVDYGYWIEPGALGNFVWDDLNGDGIQDAGEPGIAGVPVTLEITYPNGDLVTVVTTTDETGYYLFEVLLDEDYDGVGTAATPGVGGGDEPYFEISVGTPPGYAPSPIDQTDDDQDSDNHAGQEATTTQGSTDDTYDFGFTTPAAIGNYVWYDEDGDGDQDAGEAGIPNVLVTLTGNDASGNPVNRTTYTDADGGYLFSGLPPSDQNGYTVSVTPPAGLHQTYDPDDSCPLGAGCDDQTTEVLSPGEEYMDADFGYNWAPPGDTNDPPPGALGAIGDRVWIDADGQGDQDPGEAGLGNVTLRLYTDLDGDGVYENEVASTQTDAAGYYIFDDRPPDAYVVVVDPATVPTWYRQTGDPDEAGTCSDCDGQTTTPVVLGPGDVFLNADFGYQPDPTDENRESNTIGDTVFLDANGDGNEDVGEPGIPGVTVALIQDDGDGVYEPGVDPIIATDVTGENGQYLFEGLPDGDYIVWVNDTDHVLGELVPTGDGDDPTPPPATPNVSSVNVANNETNLEQDFGYAPPGHDEGEGLIGDTIFLDVNPLDGNAFVPGLDQGLEGVVVELYDAPGTTLLATTTTDENGNYTFGGLDPTGVYTVKVDATTLPAGLTNTVDPEGNGDSQSQRNLAVDGPIDLDADFGYVPEQPGRIAGTIWEDSNADGTLDGDEPDRFDAVTVVLLDPEGNVVSTTQTAPDGTYSFENLPPGDYVVDVTDDGNVLNGYWHTEGDPDLPGESQTDPKPVVVIAAQTTIVDYGYYVDPASLGNRVWLDQNDSGTQDLPDANLPNILVTLTILYPDGVTTIEMVTFTDANGFYEFGNLLLDEDYNGDGSGPEPTFTLSVDTTQPNLAGLYLTEINLPGATEKEDADDPTGTAAQPVQGETDTTPKVNPNDETDAAAYDFGFTTTPTAVVLMSFTGRYQEGVIVLEWETAAEYNLMGFDLYRAEQVDGARTRINEEMVEGKGSEGFGHFYPYPDATVVPGVTYFYWLYIVESHGAELPTSPIQVTAGPVGPGLDHRLLLPFTARNY